MAIETEIKKLTAAITELTEAIGKSPSVSVNTPSAEANNSTQIMTDIFGTGDTQDSGVTEVAQPTFEEVKLALQTYVDKNGAEMAIELLKKYKASKLTELKEANFAGFIKDAAA